MKQHSKTHVNKVYFKKVVNGFTHISKKVPLIKLSKKKT